MSSRRQLACCIPFFGFLALMAACKDDEAHPPVGSVGITTPGVGGSTEGGTTGGDSSTSFDSGNADASICTSLTQAGNLIDKIGVVGDPPVDVGGTITDGTYTLTDDTVYLGDTGVPQVFDNQKRATIRISGGLAIEQIIETRGGTMLPVIQTFNSTYNLVTPQFSRSDSCPPGAASFTYTATDATLKLTDLTLKEAFTYTLQ